MKIESTIFIKNGYFLENFFQSFLEQKFFFSWVRSGVLRRTFSKMWDESQQKWQLAHLISGNPKLFTFLIQLRWLFAKTDFAFRFCGLWAPRTYFLRLLSSHLHRSHWSWSSAVLTGEFNCAQKSAQTQRFLTRVAAWMSLVHIRANYLQHSTVLHETYTDDCWPISNF